MVELANTFAGLRNIVIFCYCWLAVVLILKASDLSPRGCRIGAFIFAVVSIGSLILMRGQTFFLNYTLNVDEAQFLASAMKFRSNLNTWASVDTTSSGPINIYPLMWPFIFNLGVSFFSARITAAVIISLTWILFWDALRYTSLPIRIAVASALVLFFGAALDIDFIHYSSELVPVCLIMVALRVTLHAFQRRATLNSACIAALCLGMVPFAKLQATVIAGSLGLMMLWPICRGATRPVFAAAALAFCAVLPTVIILVSLGPAEIHDFWVSYVGFATDYLAGGWGKTGLVDRFPGLVGLTNYRLASVFFATVTVIPVFAWVLGMGARRSGSRVAMVMSNEGWGGSIVSAIVVAASIAAVMLPGRPVSHYAVLAMWPCAVLAGKEGSRVYDLLRPSRRVALSAVSGPPRAPSRQHRIFGVPANLQF